MANNSIVSFVVRRLINIPARVREKKRRRRRRREGRSTEEGLLSPSFLLAFFPLPVSSNSFLRSSRGPDPRRFPVPRCYLAATDTRPLASEFRYVRVRLSPRLLIGTGVFRRGEKTGRWRTVVGGGRRSVGGVQKVSGKIEIEVGFVVIRFQGLSFGELTNVVIGHPHSNGQVI